MNTISGQVQGMEIGMQAVAEFGAQKEELIRAMENQNVALAQCLKACTTALSTTTKSLGHEYKYARALDDAIQLVGNVGSVRGGGASHRYNVVLGQDRAQQILGDTEGNVALAILREHRQNKQRGNRTENSPSSNLPIPEMPA